MTDRKPVGTSFSSWIDQQISEAAERGAFDDLPGAGQPLPKRNDFDGQAWLADYVRRQGGSIEDTLPAPLRALTGGGTARECLEMLGCAGASNASCSRRPRRSSGRRSNCARPPPSSTTRS